MTNSRFTQALADGTFGSLGRNIAVFRPSADYDLTGLPKDSTTIVHSFMPDVAFWQGAGFRVVQSAEPADCAVVVVPRSKALAQSLIAQACATAPFVIVDGQKTDGVDSLFKSCRKILGDIPSITKAHGRLFWFPASSAFADWSATSPAKGAHGYFTAAGVYSDGKIDTGSALLRTCLPAKLPRRMADFGAGWGYLAEAVLTCDGVQSLDLIEAELISLACARLNINDPRASFIWADVRQHQPSVAYDGIVMNPPFHESRAADSALGQSFIRAAAKRLTPQGQLWMVANRHLPYEATLSESFRSVVEVANQNGFKVFHASRPAGAVR